VAAVSADQTAGPASRPLPLASHRLRALAGPIRRVLLPVAFAVFCLLVWELALRWITVSKMILVPPSAIWRTLGTSYPILLQHMLATTIETLEGFALATVTGVALGTIITASRRIRQALYPNMVFFQLVPKIALAPLFIIWLGVGSPSRLAFAIFLAFFPIAISTASGLVSTNPDAIRLCRSLTATTWQTFIGVRFPFAIPYIFAGLKVGVTMAMIGVIVGEFVTAQAGLGYIIMFASSAGETALGFVAIGLLCVVGLALYGAVGLAELLMKRWYGAPIAAAGFV
jgi:NitT/TauT family transport system permease protein